MLRNLMIYKINEMLEGATVGTMRWEPVFRFLYIKNGGTPDTKAGKRDFRKVTLIELQQVIDNANDEGLFEIFMLVHRRYYMQY